MEKRGKKAVMMVGIDETEHSFYALEWTLTHFFPSQTAHHFQLLALHAKPSPSSLVDLQPDSGSAEFISIVGGDLNSTAHRTIQKAKDICGRKSVNVITEVVEGDARTVLCEAAERHGATVLVVGCHGYGAVKRVILGSVSDYCVQHAHCSVMVVKRPKIKHLHNSSSSHTHFPIQKV
ncbi:universal stress protein PHOS34 [Senna tora]|uniref:Universal stress protein PHOS34 n=1 Tax=Senna tora TaxID=362788 RepID=A0A834X4H3_9FABA|nr:universal stress protein PHOS34 [Senna tora]